MALLKMAAAGAVAYGIYRYAKRENANRQPAFAAGEADSGTFAKVRNAGPEAMRDKPHRWSKVDEASDESFPASDPPAMP